MANKSGIHIKKENRGKLRKKLGAKEGKNLSGKQLKKASKGADTATKKQITFAQNAKKWNKGGKKKK